MNFMSKVAAIVGATVAVISLLLLDGRFAPEFLRRDWLVLPGGDCHPAAHTYAGDSFPYTTAHLHALSDPYAV